MSILFGTSTSPTNVLLLRHVSKIYMSMAPVDNKYKYISLEDLFGIITDKSPEPIGGMFVYVVEFEDDSKPLSLPAKEFIINHITQ
jgi:hypothetical protein